MTSADVKRRFTPEKYAEKYAEYKQKFKEWVLNKYHTDEEYKIGKLKTNDYYG